MASSLATEIPTPPQMSFDLDVPERDQGSADQQQQQQQQQPPQSPQQKQRIWNRLKEWGKREEKNRDKGRSPNPGPKQQDTPPATPSRPTLGRRLSRKVGVGIPRSTTFRRQEDEQRKNLQPVEASNQARRAVSRVRQRALSAQPTQPKAVRRQGSAPEVGHYNDDTYPSIHSRMAEEDWLNGGLSKKASSIHPIRESSPRPMEEVDILDDAATEASVNDPDEIQIELEQKWILNLTMVFRDNSLREKFFVTYAETPHKWRRVTISIDYRGASPESLETDLCCLTKSEDKNARIYESIRLSLPEIKFYDTVTNLKLETREDRLHVHVTEDVNEIIDYPPIRTVQHLDVRCYTESEIRFVQHMSGFVYRVSVGRHDWIKKEIPGPDSVEEFLYEVNALSDLMGSKNVIELKGLVINDENTLVKGLLIGYAPGGALVDIIWDNDQKLPWDRREKWARQIVRGLSEVHEAGFVQGDFTISNIVVDSKDSAKIIDINRRGCPVGWEPPEIARLIESRQRIALFIGVKSDLFQLGMVLWALAMQTDEPEKALRPLIDHPLPDDVPTYYREIMAICLDDNPKLRRSGKDLLQLFPQDKQSSQSPPALLELMGQNPELTTNGDRPQAIQDLDFASAIEQENATGEKERDFQPLSQETTKSDPIELDEYGLIPKSPFSKFNNDELRSPSIERGRPTSKTPPPALATSPLSPPADNDPEDPTIVPISPSANPKWAEVMYQGTPYLVPREALEAYDGEGDEKTPNEATSTDAQSHDQQNRGDYFNQYQHRSHLGGTPVKAGFDHVDSGLADMDLPPEESENRTADEGEETIGGEVNGRGRGKAKANHTSDETRDGNLSSIAEIT